MKIETGETKKRDQEERRRKNEEETMLRGSLIRRRGSLYKYTTIFAILYSFISVCTLIHKNCFDSIHVNTST